MTQIYNDFFSWISSKPKLLKFALISTVNFVNHQVILYFAIHVLGWAPAISNVFAAMLASIPAYFMSRYWVWNVKGANSFTTEILPFWVVSILGLIFSTLSVRLAESISDNTYIYQLASIVGYVVVWFIKYFYLDKIFVRTPEKKAVA